ncbi:MAG: 6-carboxytetrahydropterin synthase QueD [Coriobacteriales bacterium]|jgi:queuosine biosynthesis protein QueD|nr:6-carboxytetrahydropterin synthase QueD [Coriobacteriales bacterium]
MKDKGGGYFGPPLILRALLNTDGGSRGNPGPGGIGFTLKVDDGRALRTICRGGACIGETTNNIAEYQALLWGLQNALALRVRTVDIHADSELLVRQLLGEYKVKNAGLKPLYATAIQLLKRFAGHTVKHIPRAYNAEADALANEAMDAGQPVGDYAVPFAPPDTLFAQDDAGEIGAGAVETPGAGAVETPGDGAVKTPGAGAVETPGDGNVEMPGATPRHAELSGAEPRNAEPPGASIATDEFRKGPHMAPPSGIYTLSVKEHFDAAHALVGYPGECRNLHGHTWDVEVTVSGTQLDEVGILYDFKALKANLLALLDTYDHHYLNEVAPFDTINATAENLARVIFEHLVTVLPAGITLEEVCVWESPIAKLSYRASRRS